MEIVSLSDGKKMVKLARDIIEAHFAGRDLKLPKLGILDEECGIFVTLKTYPKESLRGCMGYIEGIMPLREAIKDIALSSALNDPRFPPVRRDEVDDILVEVSILAKPVLIEVEKPDDYMEQIEIGKDGLIAETGTRRGLLLPQVPVEWNWNREQFLSHTCMKAGLEPDSWRDAGTDIYKFSASVFAEKEPGGEAFRVKL